CKERDIHIKDHVIVRKAGEIIPEVLRVVPEKRTGNEIEFQMATHCPKCQSILVRNEGEADYYCLNPNCEAKHLEGIIHFASRDAYNIEGLGESILTEFYNEGYINDIADIFGLEEHYLELMGREGFGEKSINNLLSAIENSKSNSLEKLVFGLGIRHVGSKVSKILVDHLGDLDNFFVQTVDDLMAINDIGQAIAQSVVDYFNLPENIDLINRLKAYGLNMKYQSKKTNEETFFTGKTVVLTGTLAKFSRKEAQEIIENMGGNVASSVSKNTGYILLGDSPGSKYQKGLTLGIPILTEEEFEEILSR
ncbi:MAG TPA: helix-hairpin-helix domain-containing protein, partial [Bacillota bacterium]|nr:helix-hairpin-helix domain-containing protein [Bacillota bacterium]